MNNDPFQQLLGALRQISWQLNEINRKLDTLPLSAAPAPAPAPAEDPKEEAIRWFQAHFISNEEGDFARFLKQLPLYPKAEEMGRFLFPYCRNGNLKIRDLSTTTCATHLLTLVKMDRKIGVEQFRRSLSFNLRFPYERHRIHLRQQELSSSN